MGLSAQARQYASEVNQAEPMIAPSILAADFARLADEAAAVDGADWLHVDVMDAHFVPNLTIGLPVVQSLRKATSLPLDCHLMIDDPDRWAPDYASSAVPTEPTTRTSASVASKPANPSRKTGWSSTINTRVMPRSSSPRATGSAARRRSGHRAHCR